MHLFRRCINCTINPFYANTRYSHYRKNYHVDLTKYEYQATLMIEDLRHKRKYNFQFIIRENSNCFRVMLNQTVISIFKSENKS